MTEEGIDTSKSMVPPIRVLHVLSSLSWRSGMLSVVDNYQAAIDSSQVRFDYLYFDENPHNRKERLEARGSRTWHVPIRVAPGGLSAMRAFFREHAGEFDVVHCHPIFMPELVGLPARRYGAKAVVAHSHSTKFSDKPRSAIRNKFLSRFVGLCATDYVACSEAARVLLGSHGKDAFVLHNAIDCARFAFDPAARAEVRAELGVADSTLLLGGVGRLAEQKNQQFLLVLLLELLRRGVDCRLAIAGSGDKEEFLRAKADELEVADRLMLLGSRSDVPRLYSAFDAFCLPSLFEGLPLSAVEAQCAGLPCLLSDAVTREVAFGDCRFLAIDDPAPWADAICSLDLAANRTGGPALARAAGFDIRVEAEKLVLYYREILGR